MQARFSEKVGYKVVVQSNTTKVGSNSKCQFWPLPFHLQVYLQEYDKEIKLNENFNNFVQNFQLAYWGHNTAHHQIGSPYDTSKSRLCEFNRL